MTPNPCRDCGVLPVPSTRVVIAGDDAVPVLVCPQCGRGVFTDDGDLTCWWNRSQGNPGWVNSLAYGVEFSRDGVNEDGSLVCQCEACRRARDAAAGGGGKVDPPEMAG